MKKRIFIIIIMACIIAMLVACDAGTSKSEQWEYKIVVFNAEFKPEYGVENFEKELNELGSDGWEYAFDSQGSGLVFKRKLPN